MKTPILVALVALGTALAGCSGGGGGKGTPEPEYEGLQATATTGVIRGVAVSASIAPLSGVQVNLRGPGGDGRNTTTGDDGLFGFDGLDPGTYFLTATKAGHLAAQASTDVVAGIDDPEIVRVVLATDPAYNPYFSAHVHEGFIECTTSAVVVCGAPNIVSPFVCDATGGAVCLGDNVTNDRYTPTLYFDGGMAWLQSEMVWESTQPAGENLYFEMEMLDSGCDTTNGTFIGNAEGPSPIFTAFNATHLAQWNINPVDCGIYYSVFSGDSVGTPPVCGLPPPAPGCVSAGGGATFEQPFTWYIHAFYGYTPPEGWQFSKDGDPPLPPR